MKVYSLKSQAAYLFLGRVLSFLIAGISPIILVRLLDRNQYGAYQQVLFVVTFVISVISLRIPGSLYYFFPRHKFNLDRLLSQTVTLLSVVSFIGTTIFLIIGLFSELLPSGVSAAYIIPITIYIFIETIAQLIDHIFILEKKSRLVLIGSAANTMIRLLLVVSAAIFFREVLTLVYALIVFSAIRLCVVSGYMAKKYAIRLGIRDISLLKNQFRYITPLAVANVVGVIGNKMDRGIIGTYMSPADFGLYAVGGIGIMNAITMLYTSVGNVCVPRFGELAISNDLKGVRKLWHKMVIVNSAFTIPLVFFCWVFADLMITILFTEKYVAASNIWRINMFILVIQMTGYGYIPTALGKTGSILAGNVIRFAVVVPLSIILIYNYGLIGGAICFVAGFWINALIQLVASKKAIKSSVRMFMPWLILIKILVISALASLILLYVRNIGLSCLPTITIGAIIYFPIVGCLYICLKLINISVIKGVLRS